MGCAMSEKIIKKYPIYYKDKEYEIRIEKEKEYHYGLNINFTSDYVNIYEVNESKNILFNYFNDKIKYKKVYSESLKYISNNNYELDSLNENYYIKLFKIAFIKYIEPIETKEKQLAALNNWDGVIK